MDTNSKSLWPQAAWPGIFRPRFVFIGVHSWFRNLWVCFGVRAEACPGGTSDNSPAFQRWVGAETETSPEGTIENRVSGLDFCRPYGTWGSAPHDPEFPKGITFMTPLWRRLLRDLSVVRIPIRRVRRRRRPHLRAMARGVAEARLELVQRRHRATRRVGCAGTTGAFARRQNRRPLPEVIAHLPVA